MISLIRQLEIARTERKLYETKMLYYSERVKHEDELIEMIEILQKRLLITPAELLNVKAFRRLVFRNRKIREKALSLKRSFS